MNPQDLDPIQKIQFEQGVKEQARIAMQHFFTYHPPKEGQPEKYEKIRQAAYQFALTIVEECPMHLQDAQIAIDKIREAIMWANASIALS